MLVQQEASGQASYLVLPYLALPQRASQQQALPQRASPQQAWLALPRELLRLREQCPQPAVQPLLCAPLGARLLMNSP